MVIFHSYVSLPEGILGFYDWDIIKPYQTTTIDGLTGRRMFFGLYMEESCGTNWPIDANFKRQNLEWILAIER